MKQNQKLRYFLYARKSTESEDRQVASIDAQIGEMTAIGKREGLHIIETLNESCSAKQLGRPVFNEMLKRIERGEAEGIISWKPDRIARNMVDGGRIIQDLQQGVIKHIRTFDGSHYPQDNVVILAVAFGMANQYSIDLATNIKRGQRARLAVGVRPGIAPIGYKNTKYRDLGKQEEIVPDPVQFPIVKRIFEYLLSGKYTAAEVHRLANNEWGLKTRGTTRCPPQGISFNNFYGILHNPFYYGEFEYGGEHYVGSHIPMITKDEFLRVQDVLLGKSGMRPHNGLHAYTGVMKCGECGCGVTVEDKWKVQKNGNKHHYILYRCGKRKKVKCSQKCINEKILEQQIDEYLAQIEISPEMHEWALQELQKARKDDQQGNKLVVLNKKKELTECSNKLERITQLLIDGAMDADTYKATKTKLESQKRELEEYVTNAEAKAAEEIERVRDRLSFAVNARKAFWAGDTRKRKEIFMLLGTDHILKDRKLFVTIEKPLIHLADRASDL